MRQTASEGCDLAQGERTQPEDQAHQRMPRQEQPELRRRDILHEQPEPVAYAMVDGKIAPASPAGTAYVPDDGVGQLNGTIAGKAKPNSEIHVLAIAEEIFVETTDS